jgi:hypothetical protein
MNIQKDKNLKLNIFGLPNQTFILFLLITFVLVGSVFLGSTNNGPIPTWPIAIALIILPIRAFLARPEREVIRYKLSLAKDDYIKTPQLLLYDGRKEFYTLGTFRHWYIVIGKEQAQELEEKLTTSKGSSIVEAKIIHELYHFKTGDYWQLGFVTQLLRLTVELMLWVGLFFGSWIILLMFATPDFFKINFSELSNSIRSISPEIRPLFDIFSQMMPTAESIEILRQKAADINLSRVLFFIISSTLPYIIMSMLLWRFYLPKLWRMREFYADAGIVQTFGSAESFINVFAEPSAVLSSPKVSDQFGSSDNQIKKHFQRTVARIFNWVNRYIHISSNNYWPSPAYRMKCVSHPNLIFDNWKSTAVLLGTLALLSIGNWPMNFITLVIITTVSLNLIPPLVMGKSIWKDIIRMISIIMGIRLIWVLVTVATLWGLLLLAPISLADLLSDSVSAIAHYAGNSETGFGNLTEFVIKASFLNIAQVVIVFAMLMVTIFFIGYLFRQMFTWYGFPKADKRLMSMAIKVIGWVIAILVMLVLPLFTLLLTNPLGIRQPVYVVSGILGGLLLVSGTLWIVKTNKQYSGKCPECNGRIFGPYRLGKTCPNCDKLLFPWLIANYDDE